MSRQNSTLPKVDTGICEEEKELWIKHGGGWGEAGQEKGLGSSGNRREPQPFAPRLLLPQEAQRKEDAHKRKRAQVRS